ALCVAYSGQCLTSEALGGRSANRGECAQACRMPYELLANGRPVDLGDRRYLLSPQDLAGLEVIPALASAGVASLKIEGRLKSAEYVASITRVYRQAIDRLAPAADSTPTDPGTVDRSAIQYELEMAFSRGLYSGWLEGVDNQRLVHARFGKKRGAFLGTVVRIDRDEVLVRPEGACKAGDGVVFDAGKPDQPEEGGRLFQVRAPRRTGDPLVLTFLEGAVDFRRIRPGDRVWKTSDPDLERNLRQTYAGDIPRVAQPIEMEVHGRRGEPLTLVARDAAGHLAHVTSSMPLAPAETRPLEEARLRDQLGRLGGTPFRLGALRSDLEPGVILPVSELNRLRRAAVEELLRQRAQPHRWTVRDTADERATHSIQSGTTRAAPPADLQWVALVRTLPQLEALAGCAVPTVYCEFEDPKRYRDAVRWVREHTSMQILLAPPRITKPGEEWILAQVESAQPDGFLVRNYDHLERWRGRHCVGDFSLNVANPLTAAHFVEQYGLERVTASYDLNAEQLEALLAATPRGRLEVTLHQHIPMFHMEHCVFCAFLSQGKDFRDCGRPCDSQVVHLRDRVGAHHPIKADAGCRNTVFNARAQTGADHALRLRDAGADRFRIEFLDETPEMVPRLIEGYRRLLHGEVTAESLWREFRLVNQIGVTRGQLSKATGSDLGVDRWTDTRAYRAAW
ncbi:MAG: U32 family peptidase, partial [Verrucomicrobiales bacterium]|nr:U32 family peptidase [Verrucomicrobiales bacterium]